MPKDLRQMFLRPANEMQFSDQQLHLSDRQ